MAVWGCKAAVQTRDLCINRRVAIRLSTNARNSWSRNRWPCRAQPFGGLYPARLAPALHRCPFRHKARSPQVRTHSFTAPPPDLRCRPLVTRASRSHARSPWSATPSIRFLFIGPQLSLHASSLHSVALTQLRFTSLTVTVTGLTPVRIRPCRAHLRKGRPQTRTAFVVERTKVPVNFVCTAFGVLRRRRGCLNG